MEDPGSPAEMSWHVSKQCNQLAKLDTAGGTAQRTKTQPLSERRGKTEVALDAPGSV